MGARGPQPTPTAILEQRGSWRAKSRPGEPRLPATVPDCPERLTGERRQTWEAASELLEEMNVLTVADGLALELLADLVSRYRALADTIAEHGETYSYVSANGATIRQPVPEVSILASVTKQMVGLMDRFGLSPAARTRLTMERGFTPLNEDEVLAWRLLKDPRGRKPATVLP